MKELISLVDKKLDEYLQITYPEDIFKAMKYTLMLPGKRLRPVMCLETVRMLGGDIEKALPTACAWKPTKYRMPATKAHAIARKLLYRDAPKRMPARPKPLDEN